MIHLENARDSRAPRRRVRRTGVFAAAAVICAMATPAFGVAHAASTTAATGAKAEAFARAHASGTAATDRGAGGGHASGRATGHMNLKATKTVAAPTAAERSQRQRAAAMPRTLTPAHPQGVTSANTTVKASSSPIAGAAKTVGAAPNDFSYFRANGVGQHGDDTNEPSVANDGNVVLYTGNWYGAISQDSGHSFTYVNPYSLGPTPTKPNGGFCCDQVAIHAPYNGITAWGLLYCPTTCGSSPSGNNIIRLAVARNKSSLSALSFDYYDFSAQDFGFPNNDWLDYPHFGVNNGSLMLTMNVFNGGSFVDNIMVKFDLAPFASGGWSANWYYWNDDFTWTPTDNSVDSWSYWGATRYNNGGFVRVYYWPPGTDYTHIGHNDFSASYNAEAKNGNCPYGGQNWCAFDDSRVKAAGEVGASTLYLMWDAKEGGGFSYPYVNYGVFDVSSGPATSFSQGQIWNSSYAWAYPGLGVDARGHLGVSLQIGGGTWGAPGSQFLIDDDISGGFAAAYLDGGAHSNTRWGDYLTSHVATTGTTISNTWLATGYVLKDDGFGGSVVTPSFYWLGRQRDDPFAPSHYYDYAPGYTEGASSDNYVGIFIGPSNCTCDYYSYVYWGDSGFDYLTLNNYYPTLFAVHGPHTFIDEGTYTEAWYAADGSGRLTTGVATAHAYDAALTATKKAFNAAKNRAFTKAVATFTDANPYGGSSDFSASIAWGDGTTSAGTVTGSVGGVFTVTGSHTYASTGTFNVAVTINDVGGSTTSVTSKATVGLLPVITSISPTSGTHNGGTTVVILGSNFTGATSVTFGSTNATSFTVNSSTKITATSPAHAAGTVDIHVTTKFGKSASKTADRFTFV